MSGSDPGEEAWLSEEPWAPFPNTMPTDCHPTHSTGDNLCQSNPLETTGRFYPDDRATESIQGFLNDGWRHYAFIVESCKQTNRAFQWFVTINYEAILSIDQIKKEWRQFSKKVSRLADEGLALFWNREITPSDPRRLHYHLGILEGFSDDEKQVRETIDGCVSHFSDNHVRVEYRRNPDAIAGYMLKLADDHRDKILLFKPGLNLKRVGHLGPFCPKGVTKDQILKQDSARKKRIKEGMSIGGNTEIARYISNFVGRPYKQIRKMVGEDPYCPVWEQWQDGMCERRRLYESWALVPQATTPAPDYEDPFFLEELYGTPSTPPEGQKGHVAILRPFPEQAGRNCVAKPRARRTQAKASWLVRSVFGTKAGTQPSANRPHRTRRSVSRPLINNEVSPDISMFRTPLAPRPSDIRLPRGHSP
jgi:hypothetical protein